MYRSRHGGPTLSPGTAKALIETFSHEHETASCSSESPDSLYSNGSPTFPDGPAFEYEEHEDTPYDSFGQGEDDGEQVQAGDNSMEVGSWSSPAWGRWPQTSRGLNSPGWSPSPRGSIISLSLSPRGSLSTEAGTAGGGNGRRLSTASLVMGKGKKRADGERRDSNPSLLGFDLAQRRRSSTRSLGVPIPSDDSSRRRSSALSIGSIEDARLRNIASMELLRRRFSEVVEVTYDSEDESVSASPSVSGNESDLQHVSRARAAISQWSPYSDESDDDSELHTASYHPTPEVQSANIPSILSNFPLASVAHPPTLSREIQLETATPSDSSIYDDISPSPSLFRAPRFSQHAHRGISTPPPPANPSAILRGKSRPAVQRATTAWEFSAAPQTIGVPPGASLPLARPSLTRSVSSPWFSAAPKAREAASLLEKRAAGTFPLARSAPLGVSPLRASLRRQSVVSDGDGSASRRGSVAVSDLRRSSAHGSIKHRQSLVAGSDSDEARRASNVLSEHRLSLVKENAQRRLSGDTRRSSKSTTNSRKSSTAQSLRRGSGADSLRRQSKDSRKSSVVSIGEYGYLAPQIVIDAPSTTPPARSAPQVPSVPAVPSLPQVALDSAPSSSSGRLRHNAPPAIVLPAYTFPPLAHIASPATGTSAAHSTPGTPLYTPRFNPMESFLGISNHSPTTPSATPMRLPPPPPLSPGSGSGSGSGSGHGHPMTDNEQTPHSSPRVSVLNRGRPVASSPEFHSFPFRPMPPTSPKSSPVLSQGPTSIPTSPENPSPRSLRHQARRVATTPSPILRKPAPKMSIEDLQFETLKDDKLRLERDAAMLRIMERRGATSATASATAMDMAILRGSAGHRRTISDKSIEKVIVKQSQQGSIGYSHSPDRLEKGGSRPGFRRQATLPAELISPRSQAPVPVPGEPLYQRDSLKPTGRSRGMTLSRPQSLSPAQSKGTSVPLKVQEKGERRISKRASVTFADQSPKPPPPPQQQQKPNMNRASSFTRFFQSHSRSKSHSTSPAVPTPTPKSALRPVSMDAHSFPQTQSPTSSPLAASAATAKYGLGLGSPRR